MVIRLATEMDVPGLLALLKQVGQVHHDIRPDIFRAGAQKYDRQALESILKDPSLPIFVAMKGGFVAGYCFCQLRQYQGDPVLADRQEIYIDDLCVDESCRGQKIAYQLFEYVKVFAREQGCVFISLNVWNGNDGAMKFYEKLGMKPRSITMDMALEEN